MQCAQTDPSLNEAWTGTLRTASLTVAVVVEQRRDNRRQAEAAEAQLYETLLLVGQKMNEARTEIRGSRPEGVVQ